MIEIIEKHSEKHILIEDLFCIVFFTIVKSIFRFVFWAIEVPSFRIV
jgi:hypothetical protein